MHLCCVVFFIEPHSSELLLLFFCSMLRDQLLPLLWTLMAVRAKGWKPCVTDWVVVCLLAALRVQLFASVDSADTCDICTSASGLHVSSTVPNSRPLPLLCFLWAWAGLWWLGGVVVSVSDSWSRGPGFDSQATTLGKLLTPMCLCHQAV